MTSTLIAVDDAIQRMLSAVAPLQRFEVVDLMEAAGRVLAEDQVASCYVPPADNSAMDGYALRFADAKAPLPISQRVAAGQAPQPLRPGTCARIFTGAEIPLGADTVVMQEEIVLTAFDDVCVPSDIRLGQNVRPKGQDIQAGQCIIKAGTRLDYRHLGLLASVGIAQVSVFMPIRIALLSTGDELVQPGQVLKTGQIYNSNRFLLQGFLQAHMAEVVRFIQVRDGFKETLAALEEAADSSDLVISTGGVSVGEEDHVKPAVEALGQLSLWRLAMKPGKPLAFGRVKETPFIGLPGNPVSTFVGAHVFVLPVLKRLAGESASSSPLRLTGRAQFSVTTQIRQEYVRVKATWQQGLWYLSAYPNQNSGVLSSAVWGNAMAIIPPSTQVVEGGEVSFFFYTTPNPDSN